MHLPARHLLAPRVPTTTITITTTTTTTTGGNTATNKNKNKNAAANKNANQAAAGGNGNNTPYVNNKYDYLDRYSAYLTPEQLQRLRTNPGNPSTAEQDETDVGGTEEAIITTAPARPAATTTATTTTVTGTPYVPSLNRQDDGADEDFNSNEDLDLDLNRMSDATGTANAANDPDAALNRGFEPEAPVAGYNPETGYGTTGTGGDANANANASGGALDAARPIVQTTAWKPIQEDVWVEHYVPGVGVGVGANSNPSNANPSNTGGGSASAAFPNRNPSVNTNPNGNPNANPNASNRIPATSGPCNGANPTAPPSLGIQHAFENVLWGSCTTTEGGCAPGDCCLYHPTFGGGACVPYDEICEPGETPGGANGGCPYGWMTSDRCLCGGGLP
mmetsp:Transcript_13618/g.39023  ORF Transcript_13618/g.39023 Transcript_13618/m.39023 type:complete len:391 (+) Transcript_13618:482-1654(+)